MDPSVISSSSSSSQPPLNLACDGFGGLNARATTRALLHLNDSVFGIKQILCTVHRGANLLWGISYSDYTAPQSLRVVKPTIYDALADDALPHSIVLAIVHAARSAIVIAELELRQIAVQMLLAAVQANAFHAALESAEIAIHGAVDRAIIKVHIPSVFAR